MSWFSKKKVSTSTDKIGDDLASSMRKLNEICQKETGGSLALFQCPNGCKIRHEGKDAVYMQIGPSNQIYFCPKCGATMIYGKD